MIKEEVLGKSYVNKLNNDYVEKSFENIDFKIFLKSLVEESGFRPKGKSCYIISFGVSDTYKMKYLCNMLRKNSIEFTCSRMNLFISEYVYNNYVGVE